MSRKMTFDRRELVLGALAGGILAVAYPILTAGAETIPSLYDAMPLDDEIMGDVNAPVTLLEYASMICPHCKSFHERIMPAIKEKYIDTGKVKYIVRPFPFNGDRLGEAAFMLAKCAPNNNYYPMLDALFTHQQNWTSGNDPVAELKRISKLAGLSEAEFDSCLKNRDLYHNMIKGRDIAVRKHNVRSTPTVFVGNERFTGSHSVESLSSALDRALGRSGDG